MAQNNVGIGTNLPDPSAKLDVKATDKGLLIPNVSLTAKNVAAPITSPAISLLVYNTNTSGAAPNNVYPGYYYWDGTIWVRLHSSDNDWTKSSTVSTPAIKTDNQYITGNAGIGDFSTADPLKSLHIKHSANTGGLLLQNTTGGAGSTTNIYFSTYNPATYPVASISAADVNSYSANLSFSTKLPNVSDGNGLTERMRIQNTGEIFGKFRHITYHTFNQGGIYKRNSNDIFYIPGYGDAPDDINFGLTGAGSNDYKLQTVVPYNGKLIKIIVRVGGDSGSNPDMAVMPVISKNGTYSRLDAGAGPTFSVESDQSGVYIPTQNNSVTRGDRIAIGFAVNCANCWLENTNYYVALVWEYDIWD
ncbi:MAG TPA: hypothetical protein PKA75_00055 [Chitinophagales bacterium]|nr:hypothetical protein [Chitinophagales bacterium]HNB48363.1 hypothetical protein [Chitinophagales bacterium]